MCVCCVLCVLCVCCVCAVCALCVRRGSVVCLLNVLRVYACVRMHVQDLWEHEARAANKLREHRHTRLNLRHRHAEILQPSGEAIQAAIADPAKLAEGMDHETNTDGHAADE